MQTFDHTQGAGSTTWTITHNLNTQTVACDVFVDNAGDLEKILPLNVIATDVNTVTVTFSASQTGSARVVGTPD